MLSCPILFLWRLVRKLLSTDTQHTTNESQPGQELGDWEQIGQDKLTEKDMDEALSSFIQKKALCIFLVEAWKHAHMSDIKHGCPRPPPSYQVQEAVEQPVRIIESLPDGNITHSLEKQGWFFPIFHMTDADLGKIGKYWTHKFKTLPHNWELREGVKFGLRFLSASKPGLSRSGITVEMKKVSWMEQCNPFGEVRWEAIPKPAHQIFINVGKEINRRDPDRIQFQLPQIS
ncbi:hypothetical protein T439DRAFT_336957 [Meredithblackwellia eburnea MCA 4105]